MRLKNLKKAVKNEIRVLLDANILGAYLSGKDELFCQI